MSLSRAAVAAAVVAVVVSVASAAPPPASSVPPKRNLRAATVDELPAASAAALRAREAAPAADPGRSAAPADQQAHIDPRTGELVAAPPGSALPTETVLAPQVDMSLRRWPNGFLYIDTSGYQHSATATIDADGNVHMQCEEPGHEHAAAEPQP
jgi:hypothetical protein